jgi:hypothetical protein
MSAKKRDGSVKENASPVEGDEVATILKEEPVAPAPGPDDEELAEILNEDDGDAPQVAPPVEEEGADDGPPAMDEPDILLNQPPTAKQVQAPNLKVPNRVSDDHEFKMHDKVQVWMPGFDIHDCYGEVYAESATVRKMKGTKGEELDVNCWDIAMRGIEDGLYQIPAIHLRPVLTYTAILR